MITAVLTVIYPGIEPFLSEFLNSLRHQSDKNFTLYIVNDGFHDADHFFRTTDIDVKEISAAGTPAKLRKIGIEWLTSENIDTIIFADSDDYFEKNRIEVLKNLLKDFDIVINELILVGKEVSEPRSVLGQFMQEGEIIRLLDLKLKNFMGLSNTAITARKIPSDIYSIPDYILAFDWAFFSVCLNAGCTATFTKKTSTYYRQHRRNTAALLSVSKDQMLKGACVKRDHYRFLSRYNNAYEELGDLFYELFEKLKSDDAFAEAYRHSVEKNLTKVPLWWEIIKLPEELGL